MIDIGLTTDFAIACDPVLMAQACGIEPDRQQAAFLRSTATRSL